MIYSDDYSLPIRASKMDNLINKNIKIKFKHQTQPPDRSQNISNKILANITLYYENGKKSFQGDPNGFAYGYDIYGSLYFACF